MFLDEIVQRFISMLFWYFRPVIKGFLRLTTRLCELQRICYGEPRGAARSLGVEKCLSQSRSAEIRQVGEDLDSRLASGNLFETTAESRQVEEQLLDLASGPARPTNPASSNKGEAKNPFIESAVNRIITVKQIKRNLHKQFVSSLRACLHQIWGYRQLIADIECLRSTSYDSSNLEHERMLLHLWSLLQPGVPLETRKTKQWQNIGFQGDDPKTDFRGMGLLGLENLVYFAKEYNSAAKHILSHSHHPKHGYSFAIVGINLTHMAYRLLKDGSAKTHLFNMAAGGAETAECATAGYDRGKYLSDDPLSRPFYSPRPTVAHFHHFYSYLFVEFDKFWLAEKPRDVMEFNRIRDLFENNIRAKLSDNSVTFKVNVAIDNV